VTGPTSGLWFDANAADGHVVLLSIDADGGLHFGPGVDEAIALGIMWRGWNDANLDPVAKPKA